MIKLTPSTLDDIPQITDWMAADEYLQNQGDPTWWLTGTPCLLAFYGQDDIGPVFYVKLVEMDGYARMYTVFGPANEVAPKRIAKAILAIVPQLSLVMKDLNCKGITFETKSTSLGVFMEKNLNFVLDKDGTYVLEF